MGSMGRGLVSLAVLGFLSTSAFGADWYQAIAAMYDRANIPTNKNFSAQPAWLGKCAVSTDRKTRTYSALYFNVDRDPLSGSVLQLIPIFQDVHQATFRDVRRHATSYIVNGLLEGSSLQSGDKAKAWMMKLGSAFGYETVYLRETTSKEGTPIFVLNGANEGSGPRIYCYYYQALAE